MTEPALAESHDDDRLERLLAEILRAEEAGAPPDRERWMREHPDLAGELASFFRNRDALDGVARALQQQALPTESSSATDRADDERPFAPRQFGDYELLSVLARGGMGVVYRARQKSLSRIVALKMVRTTSSDSPADRARFFQEAEAAARLEHPHIVPVYEVGELEGRCYYTMPLIEGGDLNSHLLRYRDPAEAAGLVERTARAVHFAHQHGVLHRDLKPANILIDDAGRPHVTDFGLARLIDSDTRMTRTGAALGTPGFMAPEAVRGDKSVTTAVDVYGLGALLYVCLTGDPPFRGANVWETLQQALDSEPPSPRSKNASIDVDLETICRKALDRDPRLRYESAAALADDLARWAAHEPIAARPPGRLRRTVKWIRRHPAASAAITAAIGASLLAGVQWIVTASALYGERQAVDRAEGLLYRTSLMLAEREWAAGARFNARQALSRCPESLRGWEWAYVRKLCDVTPAGRLGPFESALIDGRYGGDGRRLALLDVQGELRLFDETGRPLAARNIGAADSEARLAASPDGSLFFVATLGRLLAFDVEALEPRWNWTAPGPIERFASDPQADRIAVLSRIAGNAEPTLRLTLLDRSGASVAETDVPTESDSRPAWMQFVAGDRLLVQLPRHSPAGAPPLGPLEFHAATLDRLEERSAPRGDAPGTPDPPATLVSPDDRRVVYLHEVTRKRLEIRRRDGRPGVTIEGDEATRFGFVFSPDSRQLAFATQEMNIDLDDLKLSESLPIFGPLASVAAKARPWILNVHLYDVDTGRRLALLRGYPGDTLQLRFSPDGSQLLACGALQPDLRRPQDAATGCAVVWELPPSQSSRRLRSGDSPIHDLAAAPQGDRFVTADEDGRLRLWEAAGGAMLGTIEDFPTPVKSVVWSGESSRLLAAAGARTEILDVDSKRPPISLTPRDEGVETSVRRAAWSADERRIALLDDSTGEVRVREAPGGRELFRIEGRAQDATFSPDGRLLAIAYQFDLHGELKIVDATTGRPVHHFVSESQPVSLRLGWGYLRVKFSPDGRYAAAVGNTFGVHLYDLQTGRLARITTGHGITVWDVAFTSDGRRMATAGYADGLVKIWDVATGEEMHTLRGHSGHVTCVEFRADDGALYSADSRGEIRIWEAK